MVAGATGVGVTLARTTAVAAVFADLAETIFLSVVAMVNCPLKNDLYSLYCLIQIRQVAGPI
jgi:hypothetical protein